MHFNRALSEEKTLTGEGFSVKEGTFSMNEKLAIHGGQPVRTKPNPPMFPGGMAIDEREEAAVLEVLRNRRLFRYYGPKPAPSKVEEFEKKFAEVTGSRHALGVSSGTAALITALVGAGVGPGDEVIVPAYTFVASAAAVVAVNAIPVIAEVDDTLTLDPASVEQNITPYTKAIMPVHMRGIGSQMDEIMGIARRHNLKVIEDAAQADGGSYKGKMLGAIGDAGCFSLQFHKIITSGEGGVVVTNDDELILRAKNYHDTGASWRSSGSGYPVLPGVNYRMNELEGAIALVQLGKRQMLIDTMRRHKKRIKDVLKGIPGIQLRRVPDEEGDTGICIMFFLETREKALEIGEALHAEGVPAGTMMSKDIPDWHIYIHWKHILNKRGNNDVGCPFTCPLYKGQVEYSEDMCPKTLDYLERCVHMDVSPLLTDEDVDEIIEAILKVTRALL